MGNSDVVAAFGNTYVFYGKAAFYPAETSTWNPMESFCRKRKRGTGGISPFSALATALAATIGTGNIIGISTAIAIGGPGAISGAGSQVS